MLLLNKLRMKNLKLIKHCKHNDAKQHLTADTSKLQNALNGLNRTGDTNNKNQIVLNLIIKRCKHYNLKLLLLKIMQIQ